jgi:putative lipoic acid-binding regulatory protein
MQLDREVFDFPTAIPLKVIGRNEDDFEAFVMQLFVRHLSPDEIHDVAQRASRESNYLSVTVTFTAQSREHLDAIYAELNNHQRVIMVI